MRQAVIKAAALLLAAAGPAQAQQAPQVLLELFTSQGCYSCPPADQLLAERFVGRDDVVALEMHVDYWDKLVYGGSSWRDPFSSEKFTQRQLRYAATHLRQPFTPQIVIQGSYSASGTDRNRIEHAIGEVKGLDLADGWQLSFAEREGVWTTRINAASGPAEAVAVVYRLAAETDVTGGENKGKVLRNHNVVTRFQPLGLVSGGESFEIGRVEPGEGCAVIIQRHPQGVVVGAWDCGAADSA